MDDIKVYDSQGKLLKDYDLDKGWLEKSSRTEHHPAIQGVAEVFHWETVAEYPNGGKDVEKVIDVPGVEAKNAWDEEVEYYTYIPYTQEELDAIEAEKNKPSPEERIAQLEEALEMLLSGVTE